MSGKWLMHYVSVWTKHFCWHYKKSLHFQLTYFAIANTVICLLEDFFLSVFFRGKFYIALRSAVVNRILKYFLYL